MNVSTSTVVPKPTSLGTAPTAEPPPWASLRPVTARDFIALRAATTDMDRWYRHISAAAACTRPIRLQGDYYTVAKNGNAATITGIGSTASMPDGVIYKACGNRRATVCPACSRVYQGDAYQILRAGLLGGKGIPDTVTTHLAVFVTATAPSFGPVHTRVVPKHTCTDRKHRKRCDCRPNPCRARTGSTAETGFCVHGNPTVCFARHDSDDPRLGQPLCLDCYDYAHHVVWNAYSGELWRRTKQAAERYLAALATKRGISPAVIVTASGNVVERPPVAISHGKAAEMQRRGAVHFHAILRLDGVDPDHPDAIVAPPAAFTAADLEAAIRFAITHTAFTTPPHPDRPQGWRIGWGHPDKGTDVRPIKLSGSGDVTDEMVAGYAVVAYLVKYMTKSTEATGHQSLRLTADTIDTYADPDGDHVARLIAACWHLGRPTHTPVPLAQRPPRARLAKTVGPQWTCLDCGTRTRLNLCPVCETGTQPQVVSKTPHTPAEDEQDRPYLRLRRWAHMLGFGGHIFSKAQHYSVTFGQLRADRTRYRRTEDHHQPADVSAVERTGEETTLIVGAFTFAGVGWHNTGDAILANTSAAMARARRQAARDELAHQTGSTLHKPQSLAA